MTDASPEGALRIKVFYDREIEVDGCYYDSLQIGDRLEVFRQDEMVALGVWVTATQDGGLAYQARKLSPSAFPAFVALTMGDKEVNGIKGTVPSPGIEGTPRTGIQSTQLFGRKYQHPIIGKN